MESIRMASGSVLTTAAKSFIHGALWVLDCFYSYAGKFVPEVPELRHEVLNFTLSFPNGEDQDFQVSKNNYDSYKSKRMRLILDISALPNGRFQILSASNEPEAEAPKNVYDMVVETVVEYTLRATKIFQLILHELEDLVDDDDSPPAIYSNGVGADRRKLSPRKRLPESRARPFRRFVARVWEILGLFKPSHVSFDSMEMTGETSFNNHINEPKLKMLEKRKYPSPDDSDTEEASEPEREVEAAYVNDSEQVATPNELAMNDSGEIIEDTEANTGPSSNSSPDRHVQSNGKPKSYLETEEDYASEEDPDYKPTSSSGSSSEDSSLSEDNQETLEKEVNDLTSDAAREISINAVNLDHDYHQ